MMCIWTFCYAGKDKWITMTEEEIAGCKKDSNEILKIVQFAPHGEIHPIYNDESKFYLAPEKDKTGTFLLLHQVMLTMNRIALAKMVLRGKDHFIAIEPYDSVLIGYDLHFPNEIRGTGEIAIDAGMEFDDATIHLAKELVEKNTKPFDPSIIRDEYSSAMKEIIQAKADGKLVPLTEVKQQRKAMGLQEMLKESLKEAVNF